MTMYVGCCLGQDITRLIACHYLVARMSQVAAEAGVTLHAAPAVRGGWGSCSQPELVCMCSNTQSPSNSVRLTVRPAVRTSCVTLIFSAPQSRGTARTCPCLLTMRCAGFLAEDKALVPYIGARTPLAEAVQPFFGDF